ncbi:hypothetical protein [Lelliottia amnigena]|uniref:hypothetical protein n=1 Tax=Lelliottia amnigena TaxID=61646 RepID=UPI00405727F9
MLSRVSPKRIDVGLGQINIGYHAHRVVAPCDLLDPYRNLTLAATILREQHVPGKGWLHTIGHYHRPAGGAPAEHYRRQVQHHLSRILASAPYRTLSEVPSQ